MKALSRNGIICLSFLLLSVYSGTATAYLNLLVHDGVLYIKAFDNVLLLHDSNQFIDIMPKATPPRGASSIYSDRDKLYLADNDHRIYEVSYSDIRKIYPWKPLSRRGAPFAIIQSDRVILPSGITTVRSMDGKLVKRIKSDFMETKYRGHDEFYMIGDILLWPSWQSCPHAINLQKGMIKPLCYDVMKIYDGNYRPKDRALVRFQNPEIKDNLCMIGLTDECEIVCYSKQPCPPHFIGYCYKHDVNVLYSSDGPQIRLHFNKTGRNADLNEGTDEHINVADIEELDDKIYLLYYYGFGIFYLGIYDVVEDSFKLIKVPVK